MKCNPKPFEELCQHTLGVTDLDQDVIIARSAMKLWVGLENVSSYLIRIDNAAVADIQVLVWGDLPVET